MSTAQSNHKTVSGAIEDRRRCRGGRRKEWITPDRGGGGTQVFILKCAVCKRISTWPARKFRPKIHCHFCNRRLRLSLHITQICTKCLRSSRYSAVNAGQSVTCRSCSSVWTLPPAQTILRRPHRFRYRRAEQKAARFFFIITTLTVLSSALVLLLIWNR